LNYQKRFGSHFFTTEIYYRKTSEKITWIREVGDDNIMYHTFKNLNQDKAIGLEIMGNVKAFKWWGLMVSTNIYNYSITRFELEGKVQETNTYNIRGNSTFTFKWGTKFQVMPSYNGPSVNAQGTQEGFFRADIGIRHDFFNRKLNLVFKVSDVFSSATYINTSEGQNFYIYSESKRKSPIFGFSLSYKINNFKQPQRNGMNEMEFSGY